MVYQASPVTGPVLSSVSCIGRSLAGVTVLPSLPGHGSSLGSVNRIGRLLAGVTVPFDVCQARPATGRLLGGVTVTRRVAQREISPSGGLIAEWLFGPQIRFPSTMAIVVVVVVLVQILS